MTTEGGDRVFELRRYALRPGQRETLIDLFDREFVETQEAAGMSVVGQFRDLDEPDDFVWFRGFADMEARRAALTAFYTGPVWAKHGPTANATMLDSSNVLLLKPLAGQAAFAQDLERPAPATPERGTGPLWLVATHHVALATPEVEASALAEAIAGAAGSAGAEVFASLISEHSANTFPRLPVRASESVVVTLLRLAADSGPERVSAALQPGLPALNRFSALHVRPAEIARLAPTPRSRLR